MSEIGSRPYPEPWGEVQKLVAEPVWPGVSECELADLAQTARAVADLERASGDELHSHAGRLEDNHAGGGLDAGPEALRRDSAALHVHADRCEKTASILDQAAQEVREAKVELSVIGAYAQAEQESWEIVLNQTAGARWVQKLAAQSLAKAQSAAKARADAAEALFAAKLREHDALHAEEITTRGADLGDLGGPAEPPARNVVVEARPVPIAEASAAETGTASGPRNAGEVDAFEHHENAWPAQPEQQAPAPSGTPDPVHHADQPERPEHTWPPPPEDHPSTEPTATTSAQSGAAVLEHDTSPASTEAQSADLATPGEVVDVDLQESSDTAAMGAAGSVTGQAFNLANAEEQHRAPGARGYHGDEGFFGDRRDGALAQDPKSRLARLATWVKAQSGFVDGRGLAVSGEPRYALAIHRDAEGGEHVFLHSDIGPGLLLIPIPLGVWPGWEHAGDYNTRAGMLGHPDPVYSAKRLFEERQAAWAAHGLAYSLVGIATSYQIPEPESARRAVQPLNDALRGSRAVEAPFIVEADGPLVEPEDGTAHPLQFTAPELYTALERISATPWASHTRGAALGWIASIIEGSGAEDREPFANIVGAIRSGRLPTAEAVQAAWQDSALVAAQTKRNLDHAMTTPAKQRGWFHFTGYLAYHRALIGLKALDHWGQSQAGDDHRFVCDIAYLTVKARENDGDPDLVPTMLGQLPDPEQSYWRPR